MSSNNHRYLPATFEDSDGREWKVELNGQVMEEVRQELDINIFDGLEDPQGFADRLSTLEALAIVWIALRDDCDKAGIDAKAFKKRLRSGDVMAAVAQAFWESIINFTQSRTMAKAYGTVIQRQRTIIDKQAERLLEKIEGLSDEEMLQLLQGEYKLEMNGTGSSTSSPESQESIPEGSASDKSA